jgi:hypothetical protein
MDENGGGGGGGVLDRSYEGQAALACSAGAVSQWDWAVGYSWRTSYSTEAEFLVPEWGI